VRLFGDDSPLAKALPNQMAHIFFGQRWLEHWRNLYFKKMSCAGEALLSEEKGRYPIKVEVLVINLIVSNLSDWMLSRVAIRTW
jgi:hypothetical protein